MEGLIRGAEAFSFTSEDADGGGRSPSEATDILMAAGKGGHTQLFRGRALAGLLVSPVPPAPAAVLLELDAVSVVVTVLLRDVVAALALATFERYVDAPITGHSFAPG
jgi:hypothetical protein